MKRPDGLDADGCVEFGCKEGIMSRRAEQWVAEQEVEVLEAMYKRQSPPETEDRQRSIRPEPQTVRVLKPHLRSDPSQPNTASTE